MFDKFAPDTRDAVIAAERHARLLGDNVRPEHLLLAVLERGDSIGVRTLVGAGVDIDALRDELATPKGEPADPSTRRPFTADARKTLELALREALDAGDPRISGDHVLLALLREPAGRAAQLLERHGGDVHRIRVALRSGNRSFALDIVSTMQSQLDRLEREVSRLAQIVDRLAGLGERERERDTDRE